MFTKLSRLKSYTNKAKSLLDNKDALNDLIESVDTKADSGRGGLSKAWHEFSAFFRLLKAWSSGTYKDISWKSLTVIVGSLLYFIMPIDQIPDFLFFIGLTDDVAILLLAAKVVKEDLNKFLVWEKETQKEE